MFQHNVPDDVLFYMFYAMPRDQVQVAAAKSLAGSTTSRCRRGFAPVLMANLHTRCRTAGNEGLGCTLM